MRQRTTCVPCANSHRKCDQQKPTCERCIRVGKSCSYININNESKNHVQIHSSTFSYIETNGRLRHKTSNAINTLEIIAHKLKKEINAPKSNISMGSIILSSPMNRRTIIEFIKGFSYKRLLKAPLDKNIFCIHRHTKKQNLEMLW